MVGCEGRRTVRLHPLMWVKARGGGGGGGGGLTRKCLFGASDMGLFQVGYCTCVHTVFIQSSSRN